MEDKNDKVFRFPRAVMTLLSLACKGGAEWISGVTVHLCFKQNSMKVMFKCLWKNCGKVLSTAAGIQRHIRTVHLG